MTVGVFTACMVLVATVCWPSFAIGSETIRAGIIGCDTSHSLAFTKILNSPDAGDSFANVRVVAVFPGGSKDIASSRDRVGKFAEELRGMGIAVVDSIDLLLEQVDVVLLESCDGRKHLEQVRPVMAAGKRVFVDKPFAGSLADAVEIINLSKKYNTPFFSSSAMRFKTGVFDARGSAEFGQITGCAAHSPCPLEPTHPDLYWYGVHGVETLFTIMGAGCESVSRTQTEGTELVVGVWKDGRIGSFRGQRSGKRDYGALVFGTKSNKYLSGFGGYEPLVGQIAQFFKTGIPPVTAEETLDIFAFMEAADESKRQGGVSVTLESVLTKARAEVAARK
ncbi:MAG: Gfo/Idh/MocA family oxidoreductase [Planctomycetes bacterium]|nr:Gfo/Idh/MocA family oxidoreductase [Planctomycetota bacterium]